MVRQIISQDPVIIPSAPAKNLDSVVMTSFHSSTNSAGTTAIKVVLTPQDNTTKEFGRSPYRIDIDDFDNQVTQSPKLERAWNDINDIMGLAYDFFRLREKVIEATSKGEDASALITARNAALAELRAPIV